MPVVSPSGHHAHPITTRLVQHCCESSQYYLNKTMESQKKKDKRAKFQKIIRAIDRFCEEPGSPLAVVEVDGAVVRRIDRHKLFAYERRVARVMTIARAVAR